MKFFTVAARILLAGILAVLAGTVGAQPAYPGKPIRIITPYAPGGATSVMARLVGQQLTDSWGQQVLTENRGGGNTIIGTEAVAKSPPDGYTLLYTGTTHVVNASLYAKLPFDPINDFAPIASVAGYENLLVLHPSVPANTLQELIALAKAKPGQLNYATSSAGGSTHLPAELFNMLAGIKTQHIPYKGGGPAVIDLIGGQVQMYFAVPINVIGHVKSGKLKAVAVSGEKRLLSALPLVPTFAEAGLPGFNVTSWHGMFAPAGTPRPIVDKLAAEVAKMLASPEIKEKLDSQGLGPFFSAPDEYAAMLKTDLAKYARIVKAANIKMEE